MLAQQILTSSDLKQASIVLEISCCYFDLRNYSLYIFNSKQVQIPLKQVLLASNRQHSKVFRKPMNLKVRIE